jgi:hypothetical protein
MICARRGVGGPVFTVMLVALCFDSTAAYKFPRNIKPTNCAAHHPTWICWVDMAFFRYTCHTAFFVAIVIVQWADLVICKTRLVISGSFGLVPRWVSRRYCILALVCRALPLVRREDGWRDVISFAVVVRFAVCLRER